MPREVEAARLPRLALTLHLREALAVQLEHSLPLRLDRRPLPLRLLELELELEHAAGPHVAHRRRTALLALG